MNKPNEEEILFCSSPLWMLYLAADPSGTLPLFIHHSAFNGNPNRKKNSS